MKPESRPLFVILSGIIAVVSIHWGLGMNTAETSNASNQSLSMREKKEGAMKILQIDIKILSQPVRLSSPCMVEVRLTNKGPQSVVLNKRLSVGYKNSLSRELFLELFKKGTNVVVSKEGLLYERPFSSPEDYVPVEPEQSIATTFNPFEWYSLPSPGEYELVVYYQADENLAYKPVDLLLGTYSSERIALTIIP